MNTRLAGPSNPTSGSSAVTGSKREVDPVAVARGYLAAALDRCAPGVDAALEVCALWSELDEPSRLPDLVTPALPRTASVLTCLDGAQETLRAAIRTIEPAARALTLAAVVRHLAELIEVLDTGCDDAEYADDDDPVRS